MIHDADLEYHPKDLLRIVEVFQQEHADAVYGSRFAGGAVRRVLMFRHELGNKFLTLLSNLVTNLNLSDMETCYKAVRTDLLKSIPLVLPNDFRIEPELTIKLGQATGEDLRGSHQLLGQELQRRQENQLARRPAGASGHCQQLALPYLDLSARRVWKSDSGETRARPAFQCVDGGHDPWPLRGRDCWKSGAVLET